MKVFNTLYEVLLVFKMQKYYNPQFAHFIDKTFVDSSTFKVDIYYKKLDVLSAGRPIAS